VERIVHQKSKRLYSSIEVNQGRFYRVK